MGILIDIMTIVTAANTMAITMAMMSILIDMITMAITMTNLMTRCEKECTQVEVEEHTACRYFQAWFPNPLSLDIQAHVSWGTWLVFPLALVANSNYLESLEILTLFLLDVRVSLNKRNAKLQGMCSTRKYQFQRLATIMMPYSFSTLIHFFPPECFDKISIHFPNFPSTFSSRKKSWFSGLPAAASARIKVQPRLAETRFYFVIYL